mmetsp:Transcript_985/g.2107  ORF Transcript_985/g.2107 Transcript_985/m.2107 type:complete len:644 (-) Transcript_985:238-2169(-)
MGRGKNNRPRRRSSLNNNSIGLQPILPTAAAATKSLHQPGIKNIINYHNNSNIFTPNNNHFNAVNNNLLPIQNNNNPGSDTQEVLDVIEFHWKNLSLELKSFLLKNPQELSLNRFVDFWSSPIRIESTYPNIAASICGCSWYLALNYMSICKIVEARALILNGCFLQQCYNKPIEEIAAIASPFNGPPRPDDFQQSLPFFTDGLLAISSEARMSCFLRTKVSSDYQRRMSFATQTTQTKKKVQDYVNQISSDWDNNGSNAAGAVKRKNIEAMRRRRASLELGLMGCGGSDSGEGSSTNEDSSFIDIVLVDGITQRETKMRYGITMTLKSLFKKYAEDRNLSLRRLRFTYEGRTLFLSSVGSKTPQDLGMKDLDCITVIDNQGASVVATSSSLSSSLHVGKEEDVSGSSSSDDSKSSFSTRSNEATRNSRGNRNSKSKSKAQCYRRASWAGPELLGEEEKLKLQHSRHLSRVIAEAAPRFEQIRQKLNALNLSCTPPKVKGRRKKFPVERRLPLLPVKNNPNNNDEGGKAGVPYYAVHVGAAENLYNTNKKYSSSPPSNNNSNNKAISIDLHGRTREEALSDLNAKLPEWIDVAMRGSYPFITLVIIVCGGGNQILSEAVEGWIKGSENVAKAPQKKYSRRRSV